MESERWKKYVDTFLKSEGQDKGETITEIDRLLNPEQIQNSLFPGVGELYSLLSAEKYYVSRNLPMIVQKYGQHLGFRDTYGEVEQKGNFVEQFVRKHPALQHYLVRGNSDEDKAMVDVLQSSIRRRKIKSVGSIFVAGNGKNPGFEIETSRNQTGLVELLKLSQK